MQDLSPIKVRSIWLTLSSRDPKVAISLVLLLFCSERLFGCRMGPCSALPCRNRNSPKNDRAISTLQRAFRIEGRFCCAEICVNSSAKWLAQGSFFPCAHCFKFDSVSPPLTLCCVCLNSISRLSAFPRFITRRARIESAYCNLFYSHPSQLRSQFLRCSCIRAVDLSWRQIGRAHV